MSSSAEAILIIAALAVAVLAVSMIRYNRAEKEKFFRMNEKSWGGGKPPQYSDEAFRQIRLFSDFFEKRENGAGIDDITWNDSDMDRVFLMANRTFSSPGEDVLYMWLRRPLSDEKSLSERDRLITECGDNRELRRQIRMIANRVGRGKKGSYFADALKAAKAPETGNGKYIFLCILTVLSLALLFVQPVAGICMIVADFIVNIAVSIKNRTNYRGCLRGFREIQRLLRGAEQLMRLDLPDPDGEKPEISGILEHFRGFQKGAFWITGSGSVGTGIGDVILEYVNLFFHFDMIQYGKMVREIRGKEEEIAKLVRYVGGADAAVSAASFRVLLKNWCRPDLVSCGRGFLKTEQLCHPLLPSPVKNSISTDGGNLITGANASGKSTFLKSVSIGAILAQSLATVPAQSWQGTFFRVCTSMALTDNLSGGESYFVVEIRSLKRIMDAAGQEGVPVLGMIDEVLRGTNTIERIAASSQVLQSLDDGKSLIFAATHDMELTEILAPLYHNYHFSGTVRDRDVKFDYRIKEGPTRERNAIALMAAAGYDKELADRAEASAEHFEQTGEWKL